MTRAFHRAGIVLAFLAASGAVGAGVWRYGHGQALDRLAEQGQADLALFGDRLTGQLQRYRVLAVLMADHPMVQDLAAGLPAQAVRDLLLEVADKTAALDVMFLDRGGRVVAAARTPPGAELGGVGFVQRAGHGALGWGHSAESPLAQRAFYYAAPVFGPGGKVSGSVLVAADIAAIENSWRGGMRTVFFTDRAGTVFVSNRSELVHWQRAEAGPGLAPPSGPAPDFDSYRSGPHEIWQLGWGPYLPRNALHLTQPVPVIGMTGEVLLDVAPARRLAALQAAAVAGLCLAFGAVLFQAAERRRTLARANAQLEARVASRTAALSDSNAQLLREAREREEAQAALARAQADLARAGKLSALGQMSAGISHELNQPLMAIGSFADNAVQFLGRGDAGRASANLARISEMAQRMGRIIRNLRAFARQEAVPQGRVDAVAALDAALELTATRIEEAGVRLVYDRPDRPAWVRGGDVRLGQVFVNLISNACDAMAGSALRELRITLAEGAAMTVNFADTGPGIEMPDKVFDPFYTTKAVGGGEGMGLGLSISYGIVQSFGGDIKGSNTADGALFTVTLEPMPEAGEAAA